jgi:hypothetical protein
MIGKLAIDIALLAPGATACPDTQRSREREMN